MEGRQPTPAERNLTVSDLARRNDPQFDRHLQQQIAATKPKIEQSIHALNQALPRSPPTSSARTRRSSGQSQICPIRIIRGAECHCEEPQATRQSSGCLIASLRSQ